MIYLRKDSVLLTDLSFRVLSQAKLKSFAAKIIQLLKEWTETFPYDFQDEKSMKELKEIAHRITQCDEVRKKNSHAGERATTTATRL